MNKNIFFAIFLIIVLSLSAVSTVQAANNDNVIDSISNWFLSFFKKDSQISNYPSELTNSPSEVSNYNGKSEVSNYNSESEISNYNEPSELKNDKLPSLVKNKYIVASLDEGYVGDTIELYGHNFQSFEQDIIIRFNGQFIGTTNANDNGEFVWLLEIPMPNDDKEFYLIEAVDSNGYIIYDKFTILWNQPGMPLIHINPMDGQVGDSITVYGKGFEENGENIIVRFEGNILLGYTDADANGEFVFDTIVPMPNDDKEFYLIEAVDTNGYIVYSKFHILWNNDLVLTATPDEGFVNDIINLKGTGYIPNTELAIFLNPANPEIIATSLTDANGDFVTTFVVPDLIPDMYIMNVFNLETSIIYNVFEEFTILDNETQPNLTLIATPDEGFVNDVINLVGTGYIPGDNLIILFEDEIILTTSMGSSGNFDTTFVVPDLAPGDYNINVYGTNMSSMYDVVEVFTILDNGTQPDDPSITLSAPGGHVGETRTVYGHDFLYLSSNETITIRMAGIIIAEFQWSDAEFEVDFVVPDLAPGNNYFVSVDNYPTAYAYFDVLEGPYFSELYVNPEQGYVGDLIDIWGNDYPANDTLVIMMAGQVIATPTTDVNGEFVDTFNVPNVPVGDYEITVIDRAGTADFEVLDNSQGEDEVIFVDPISGYPGDVIDVWGDNFTVNTNLTLYLGSDFVVTVMTDDNGSFTGQFIVPDISAGLYDISVIGYSVTTPFLVLEPSGVTPDLFVNPDSGYAGDVVILSGINFNTDETLVVYLGGEVIVMPTTDSNGAFITTFTVPNWAEGDYVITVFGYNVSEDFEIFETEEEEEEEAEEYDDDWNDSTPREQHRYYMEGLTCDQEIEAGKTGRLSFEVVNRGITDEQDMIVNVWCESLGINLMYENIVLERLEPNLIEIPIDIPGNTKSGEYSCMVEMYSEMYAYEKLNRITDSINFIVEGEPVEGIAVVYLADVVEEDAKVVQELNNSGVVFGLSILILALIVFFVYKIYVFVKA